MLEYYTADVYLKEIPDEISLGFSIIGCPHLCYDCHSSHLNKYSKIKGTPLTTKNVEKELEKQKEVSCILFLGGDWDIDTITKVSTNLKNAYQLPLAIYSGLEIDFFFEHKLNQIFTYIKTGRYEYKLGGLDSRTTNQHLYKLQDGVITADITPLFWKFPTF